MKLNEEERKRYIEAKKKVRRIQIFYLHLVLYIIVVALILFNLYIIEGPYTNVITGLNISTIVFWTIFIFIHGWSVFKGKLFFSKRWEDKKIEQILKDKNKEETFWE